MKSRILTEDGNFAEYTGPKIDRVPTSVKRKEILTKTSEVIKGTSEVTEKKPYHKMTKVELKAELSEKQINFAERSNKEDLIQLLEQQEEVEL